MYEILDQNVLDVGPQCMIISDKNLWYNIGQKCMIYRTKMYDIWKYRTKMYDTISDKNVWYIGQKCMMHDISDKNEWYLIISDKNVW